jgi:uncharacterized OsmC-like protein
MEEDMATITTHHKGEMLFETRIGDHRVLIDVPPTLGGSNRGPTPPEFFIASLGSCVAALVADYCQRSGINTDGLSVDVSYEKGEDPTRLTDIRVRIDLPNGDYARREKAILRVAERCPVHQTISSLDAVKISLNGHGPQ